MLGRNELASPFRSGRMLTRLPSLQIHETWDKESSEGASPPSVSGMFPRCYLSFFETGGGLGTWLLIGGGDATGGRCWPRWPPSVLRTGRPLLSGGGRVVTSQAYERGVTFRVPLGVHHPSGWPS